MDILLIDDHLTARVGTGHLIRECYADVAIVEAESVDEGLVRARAQALNLVLLDIQFPGDVKDGLDGLAELRREFPDLCVVMLSGSDDRETVLKAMRLGAMGFIPKSVSRPAFVEALGDVISGRPYIPHSVVRHTPRISSGQALTAWQADRGAIANSAAAVGLTAREYQVLGWLVHGKSNKEIARRLNIHEQTVRNHLRPIYLKFGVARRTELMAKVYEWGLSFEPPDVGNG